MINGRNGQHIRLYCTATYVDNCKYAPASSQPKSSSVDPDQHPSPGTALQIYFKLIPMD